MPWPRAYHRGGHAYAAERVAAARHAALGTGSEGSSRNSADHHINYLGDAVGPGLMEWNQGIWSGEIEEHARKRGLNFPMNKDPAAAARRRFPLPARKPGLRLALPLASI